MSEMTTESPDLGGFVGRWIRSSALGWLLGLFVVIVLALLGDLLSFLVGSDSQSIVGVGIGWGVGYIQSRALRAWLTRPALWAVASTVGMGTLFVIHDIVNATGHAFPFSLPIYVLIGSLITGPWQSVLLRHASNRAHLWVAGCLFGWAVPAACIALGDVPALGVAGGVVSLTAIFLGGAMLGAASGAVLHSVLRGLAA